MSSEIGFIFKGTKIRVGEVRRNKGRLLPVVVKGKVAYVKVEDIESNNKLNALQSVTERMKMKETAIDSIARIAFMGASHSSNFVDTNAEDTEDNNALFIGGGLRGYYRNLKDPKEYRTSVNFYTASKAIRDVDVVYTYADISIDYMKSFIQTDFFDLSLVIGGIFVPYFEYEARTLFTISGYGGGAQVGADMRFSLGDKWSLHLDGAYQYIYLTGFELPENDIASVEESVQMAGIKAGISFSYLF